jgi:hypothetical protein
MRTDFGTGLRRHEVHPTVVVDNGSADFQRHDRRGGRHAQGAQAAILCQWGIELSVQATGENCFKGQDPEFQSALKDSISEIDAFIIKNAPTTPEQLAARKASAASLARRRSSGRVRRRF